TGLGGRADSYRCSDICTLSTTHGSVDPIRVYGCKNVSGVHSVLSAETFWGETPGMRREVMRWPSYRFLLFILILAGCVLGPNPLRKAGRPRVRFPAV